MPTAHEKRANANLRLGGTERQWLFGVFAVSSSVFRGFLREPSL